MPYDPKIHHRKSIRLKGFDYSRPGYYFVTFATHDLRPIFGEIINGELRLNSIGMIAWQEWVRIAHLRKGIVLDEFIIMPNHIHAIIKIEGDAEIDALQSGRARLAAGAKKGRQGMKSEAPKGPKAGSIGAIIAVYKSIVSRKIKIIQKYPEAIIWHRNFHEAVIRDSAVLEARRNYIRNNPGKWGKDKYQK